MASTMGDDRGSALKARWQALREEAYIGAMRKARDGDRQAWVDANKLALQIGYEAAMRLDRQLYEEMRHS